MSTEIYFPHAKNSIITGQCSLISKNMPGEGAIGKPINKCQDEMRSYCVSSWCVSRMKRAFELVCVIPTLIVTLPLMGVIAIAIKITSSGPVIFRQKRAGQYRKLFTIYKFRTMVVDSELNGPWLTAVGDPRIIRIGHFLRRFKLDELPQLFNVLRGDMSLVGPRPKLPELELSSMPCRPGVTGAATLLFRKEQHLLQEIPTDQIKTFYSKYIAPTKVKVDADYMSLATFRSDFRLIRETVAGSSKNLTQESLIPYAALTPQALPIHNHHL